MVRKSRRVAVSFGQNTRSAGRTLFSACRKAPKMCSEATADHDSSRLKDKFQFRLLGPTKVFRLLGGAEQAEAGGHHLVALLAKLERHESPESLEGFVHSRRRDKEITQELTEQLCKTFITPLEREDIQALAAALYKIPKTVEKIGERIVIFPSELHGLSFKKPSGIARSRRKPSGMVKELRTRHRCRNPQLARKMPSSKPSRGTRTSSSSNCSAIYFMAITTPSRYFPARSLTNALEKVMTAVATREISFLQVVPEVFVSEPEHAAWFCSSSWCSRPSRLNTSKASTMRPMRSRRVVSTKVLTPRQAIALAAFFNLTAP